MYKCLRASLHVECILTETCLCASNPLVVCINKELKSCLKVNYANNYSNFILAALCRHVENISEIPLWIL